MNAPITIHLPGIKAHSWNDYWSGKHWTTRRAYKHAMALLVRGELDPNVCEVYSVPVAITVTATYKSYPVDCSNVCAKPIEDALIGLLIANDDPKHVRSFTTISREGKDDSITIHLQPIEEE